MRPSPVCFALVSMALAATSLTAQDKKKESAKDTPKVISLSGCVVRGEKVNDPIVIEDKTEGRYRLSGINLKDYLGQRVQIAGGEVQVKKLTVKGGLYPSPNVAAQAGKLVARDPQAQPGGPAIQHHGVVWRGAHWRQLVGSENAFGSNSARATRSAVPPTPTITTSHPCGDASSAIRCRQAPQGCTAIRSPAVSAVTKMVRARRAPPEAIIAERALGKNVRVQEQLVARRQSCPSRGCRRGASERCIHGVSPSCRI